MWCYRWWIGELTVERISAAYCIKVLGPQTAESPPTGCLSVLKVGRSMVIIVVFDYPMVKSSLGNTALHGVNPVNTEMT